MTLEGCTSTQHSGVALSVDFETNSDRTGAPHLSIVISSYEFGQVIEKLYDFLFLLKKKSAEKMLA